MKEDPGTDELLNGFIDGELTARQHTKVQRLIKHDAQIARRLRELQSCKMLVGSLPCAEAPDGMADNIKAALEKRTLLSQQPEFRDERKGARHLLARKVLAAAALIGLVAVLGAVIYDIIGPESIPEEPIVSRQWRPATKKVEAPSIEEPVPSVAAAVEKPAVRAGAATPAAGREMGFNGRLELRTGDLVAVDAFINRAIGDNGLKYTSLAKQKNRSVYAVSCSRETLGLLLADLENVWARLDSAALFVQTERFGDEIVVGGASAAQIAEIVNQDSFKGRIEVAKDFAVLNNMAELLPGRQILAAIGSRGGDLVTIPKPVLTSREKTVKKPADRVKDEVRVTLTIVVTGAE